jgi:hypothetical protein
MINEQFLNNVAAGLNGEALVVPGYVTHGTTSITVTPTMTSLDGEQASRLLVSSLRENNLVTFTALRSGANVGDTVNGDTLFSSALFDEATEGSLLAAVTLPGLLHTTSFDIETSWDISIERD